MRQIKSIDVFVSNRKKNQRVEEKHQRDILLDSIFQALWFPFNQELLRSLK